LIFVFLPDEIAFDCSTELNDRVIETSKIFMITFTKSKTCLLEATIESGTGFETCPVENMTQNLAVLIENGTKDPTFTIHNIPLLSEQEQQTLTQWNEIYQDFPVIPLQCLFETHVKLTPKAIAVKFEEAELTYDELNDKANQLAHYLRGLG
jgi:hypothetical protein